MEHFRVSLREISGWNKFAVIIQVRVLEEEIRTSAAVLVRIPEQRIPPNKGRPISSVRHFPRSPFQEGLIVLSNF